MCWSATISRTSHCLLWRVCRLWRGTASVVNPWRFLNGVLTSVFCSYLWPGYTDESSNHHVLLLVLLINVKRREHLDLWSVFESRPDDFAGLFRRILSLTLETTLSPTIRTHLLSFFISAFQSLDCAIVRKECAPLVSISIWQNLSSDALRETKLDQHPHARKAWRASVKRYDAADESGKSRLRFDRSWLYTLVLDLIKQLYDGNAKAGECARNMETSAF